MSQNELDRLLIENLKDLDEAAKRVRQIESLVWRRIEDAFRNWAPAGWKADVEKDYPWAAANHWCRDDVWEGSFYLDYGPEDTGQGAGEETLFDLSRYVGINGGQLCLWFEQDVAGARKWKTLANDHVDGLSRAGFSLSDGGSFYTNCTLEGAAVAEAIESNDWDGAMKPIVAALDRARVAVASFDALLDQARQI